MINIRKIMITAALGLALVTPAIAADCPEGRGYDETVVALTNTADVSVKPLSTEQMQMVFDKKGRPPNAEGEANIDALLITTDQFGVIMFFQNKCWLINLGPAVVNSILDILGMANASSQP